ncbi:MAG: hypothetical protein K0M45_08530 [Candidatus Paracaedibacteraceae bacterium]|nr:hypothetical protein [Candidatus Paracaedibacteraceae bacterium]
MYKPFLKATMLFMLASTSIYGTDVKPATCAPKINEVLNMPDSPQRLALALRVRQVCAPMFPARMTQINAIINNLQAPPPLNLGNNAPLPPQPQMGNAMLPPHVNQAPQAQPQHVVNDLHQQHAQDEEANLLLGEGGQPPHDGEADIVPPPQHVGNMDQPPQGEENIQRDEHHNRNMVNDEQYPNVGGNEEDPYDRPLPPLPQPLEHEVLPVQPGEGIQPPHNGEADIVPPPQHVGNMDQPPQGEENIQRDEPHNPNMVNDEQHPNIGGNEEHLHDRPLPVLPQPQVGGVMLQPLEQEARPAQPQNVVDDIHQQHVQAEDANLLPGEGNQPHPNGEQAEAPQERDNEEMNQADRGEERAHNSDPQLIDHHEEQVWHEEIVGGRGILNEADMGLQPPQTLLDQIRRGERSLNPVENRQLNPLPSENNLANQLRQRIENRRRAIQDDDSDSDTDSGYGSE